MHSLYPYKSEVKIEKNFTRCHVKSGLKQLAAPHNGWLTQFQGFGLMVIDSVSARMVVANEN